MALTERYTIDQKLGEGGFGAVFSGTHRQMSTPVAIKVLHAQHASSAETVARFEQEARRSASLKHPNTIRVFDFGRDDDGSLFLVMELLDGAPLSHHIKQGRLAPDRVAHILAQALSALDEAHQQGLVHRDLKPDNIFLTRLGKDADFVKVLDFGIAKALDADAKLTASGVVIGTPIYMSPEQCRGAALDPRSDLYSLGCIAYEMLAGRPPFMADNVVGYIFAHVQQAPDLTKLAPNVPEPLVAWVGRCLEKDPAARFSSADEARDALLAAVPVALSPTAPSFGAARRSTSPALPSQTSHPPPPLDTSRSPASRRTGLWLALGGGLVAVALLVWGIVEITASSSYIASLPEPEKVVVSVSNVGDRLDVAAASDTAPPDSAPTVAMALADTSATGTQDPSPDLIERAGSVAPPDTTVAAEPDTTPASPDTTGTGLTDTTPPDLAAPASQRVALSSVPTGATVKRGGKVLGKTPLELTWLVGETTPFKVELKNYDTATLRLNELTGKSIHELRLTRTTAKDAGGEGERNVIGSVDTGRERVGPEPTPEPTRTGPSRANIQAVIRSKTTPCGRHVAGTGEVIRLTNRFTIRPDGTVQNVDVTAAGAAPPALVQCVKSALGSARFETFTGSPVSINYPLQFR
ncbi:MAG TPA: protein kinase [Myxococcota bacterium]|nr:protein kinase [Myxococcota bacterium]